MCNGLLGQTRGAKAQCRKRNERGEGDNKKKRERGGEEGRGGEGGRVKRQEKGVRKACEYPTYDKR